MIGTKIKAAVITFVMTAAMLGGNVSASIIDFDSTDASKATELKENQEVYVKVDGEKNEADLYKFVPEHTGYYRVLTRKGDEMYFCPGVFLYDSNFGILNSYQAINSPQLEIKYCGYTFELKKGETYYVKAKSSNSQQVSDYHLKFVFATSDTSSKLGWMMLENQWYYFDKTGLMARGWMEIGSYWYYFGADHAMATGWQKIKKSSDDEGTWYYFDKPLGHMITGWKLINGKWYYFNTSGEMATGWKAVNGKWYYFNIDGDMVTGWKSVEGSWYYFNKDGDMATGWKAAGGNWYYLNSNGTMKTGWLYSGGKWYYLVSSGNMVTGKCIIDGVTYIFDSNGVCTNP